MKIIFLNMMRGEVIEPLTEFITHHVGDTDIFCFQEAPEEMTPVLKKLLPNHYDVSVHDYYNVCTYIHKDRELLDSGIVFNGEDCGGLGVYTKIVSGTGSLTTVNVHGSVKPNDKTGSPERRCRSEKIIEFLKAHEGFHVVGGDFNVLPDTRNVQMFSEAEYKDLIKDYKIPTTRNHLAWDKHPTKMLYSDYIFLRGDVSVKNFTVPNIEISDHLPLILELE